MACAHPITMNSPAGPISVRCKQCLPCRIYKQSSLTLRCLLENRTSWSSQFITLTYSEAPLVGSYSDMASFLNRLRTWNRRQGNQDKIAYLACGEYGTKSRRFHYHALIFNSLSPSQEDFDTRLWRQGFVHTGQVTPASIRYTARYTLKFEQNPELVPVAGWSKKPPLGSRGIRKLAAFMRNRGDKISDAPTVMNVDGRSYPVDRITQIEFMEEYDPKTVEKDASGTRKLVKSSALHSAAEHRLKLILGDPDLEKRRADNERAEWWSSIRQLKEKL